MKLYDVKIKAPRSWHIYNH